MDRSDENSIRINLFCLCEPGYSIRAPHRRWVEGEQGLEMKFVVVLWHLDYNFAESLPAGFAAFDGIYYLVQKTNGVLSIRWVLPGTFTRKIL